MYTRCPQCQTVFRVTSQQLQMSSGQVRCGQCQQVFDAFAALSVQLPVGSGATQPPAANESAQLPASAEGVRTPAEAKIAQPSVDADLAQPPTKSALIDEARGATVARIAESAAEPKAGPAVLRDVAPLTLPDQLFGAPAHKPKGSWLWGLGSALLVVVLLAQTAWFFPGELATRLPEARDLLRQYCARTGCAIALPRLPEQLYIEASDLQMLDPAHPSEVLLTATIRNRAPLAQAFPLLDLTLTDQTHRTAARKVFAPEDYLERGINREQGFGANQEVSLRLYLDTGAVRPAGYRLYLFFG